MTGCAAGGVVALDLAVSRRIGRLLRIVLSICRAATTSTKHQH
jgi:hypothetical protein